MERIFLSQKLILELTLTRGDKTFDLDVVALLGSQGTADKVSLISDANAATPEASILCN